MADVRTLGQTGVIGRGQADVARHRERNRQRRMQRSLAVLGPLAMWLWWRQLFGTPVALGLPHQRPARVQSTAASTRPAKGVADG